MKMQSNGLAITGVSLANMISEMMRKGLELKRITKTALLIKKTGFLNPSLFSLIADRCTREQRSDGGWVSIVDTMWNVGFLKELDSRAFQREIENGFMFLTTSCGPNGLWGRSYRDFERIPVTGIMLSLFPELATQKRLNALENLWNSEKFSLTYKAAYTLMAFAKNQYHPQDQNLILDTVSWLLSNQRDDGSFAPWKEHPVQSDTFCTAIALLGLLSYPQLANHPQLRKSCKWLWETRISSGVWPCHEIEDGSSWALLALKKSQSLSI